MIGWICDPIICIYMGLVLTGWGLESGEFDADA